MSFSVSYTYRIDDRYTRPLQAIQQATSKFRAVAKKTSAVVTDMGSRIGGLEGMAAALAGTLGGAALINKFIGFEEQVNATAGVLNATEEQFLALKKTAIDLGSTTKFTAAEVGSGMLMLAKNSLNLADTMGAIPAVLSLSASTGADLSLAADLATDVMANFNATAADLPDIMNKIAGATVKSKFDIQKLTFALANSSAQAKVSGVSFNDTITTIAAISSSFASGERAGTSFAWFMKRLTPSTKEQSRWMKRLGFITKQGTSVFRDSTGALKGMAEISDILNAAFSRLSPAELSVALEKIWGSVGSKTAIALANVGSENFNKLTEGIESVNVAELAERRLRGLVGSIKLMYSALDALVIKVFEADVAGIIGKMADAVTLFANAIGTASPWVKKMVGVVGILVAALLPLLTALKIFVVLFAPLKVILVGLGAIFAGISAPIWGTVAAVAAVIAGLGLLIAKWDAVKAFLVGLPKSFKAGVPTFEAPAIPAETEGPGVAAANAKAVGMASTLNGEINVNAPPGVVNSTSLEVSAPGDLGMNLAGTI